MKAESIAKLDDADSTLRDFSLFQDLNITNLNHIIHTLTNQTHVSVSFIPFQALCLSVLAVDFETHETSYD